MTGHDELDARIEWARLEAMKDLASVVDVEARLTELKDRRAAGGFPLPGRLTRVAIVEDHPQVRDNLAQLVADSPDCEVVAAVGSVAELRRVRGAARPDVILHDLYLRENDQPWQAVAEHAEAAAVLVLSASMHPADVLGAIQAGASGYLSKAVHTQTDLLMAAIRTVAAGGFAMSAELADLLLAELSRVRDGQPQLSPREEEALSTVACGFNRRQTAERMGVSPATVDTYFARIRAKLDLRPHWST
jgi:DNA-binding NarL/FixJ family response regulator